MMMSSQGELLKRWERKILRRIFGAVQDNEVWSIRTNAEPYFLFKDPDIVTTIKHGRIRQSSEVDLYYCTTGKKRSAKNKVDR